MQRRKIMDFNFTRAMMKSKKANPIKFKSNWSKESKEIASNPSPIRIRIPACIPISIWRITFVSDIQSG